MNRDIAADAAIDQPTLRPFEAADFEAVARLFSEAWCGELGEPAARISGELCVANYLAASTWGCVAERGDEALGVILSAEKGQLPLTGGWEAKATALRAELEAEPELAASVELGVAGIAEERELGARFEATGAAEADVEFKLLIVSSGARGLGVGRRLVELAERHARNNGGRGYFLLTDDDCDVSFYDHLGLRRAMKKNSEVAWPSASADDEFNIYVYAQRFE